MTIKMKKSNSWFLYAILTTLFWGLWGAFSFSPVKNGFPGTLIYVAWAFSMLIPAIVAFNRINWRLEYSTKSILLGSIIGFTGAGGQLALLTRALTEGPAHLIFPIISLSPIITIILSFLFLKEKVDKRGTWGIMLAIIALPLLSLSPPTATGSGLIWLVYALVVMIAWGFQAFVMKFANESMKAESIFIYMTITGLLLVPIPLFMTDFSIFINTGFSGMYMAFFIQLLNSLGALFIVYAFRYGKAVVVSPMTNAVAPVITIVISLILYQTMPSLFVGIGMFLAVISTFLLAKE
jgi:drug/metabolite transporter (DMT)-like permease